MTNEIIDPEHGATVNIDPRGAQAAEEATRERCQSTPEGGWSYIDRETRCTLPDGHEGRHEDGPITWGEPLCNQAGAVGAVAAFCTLPDGHEGGHRDALDRPMSSLASTIGPRVVKLSELPEDAQRIVSAILGTAAGEGCGECDACKQAAAKQPEQATPRPVGALDARVRILELPHYRGALVAGVMRAPFALVVDMLGTLEHVGAQEPYWTEHGKAMGAVRTIVAAGSIDLDGAEL